MGMQPGTMLSYMGRDSPDAHSIHALGSSWQLNAARTLLEKINMGDDRAGLKSLRKEETHEDMEGARFCCFSLKLSR